LPPAQPATVEPGDLDQLPAPHPGADHDGKRDCGGMVHMPRGKKLIGADAAHDRIAIRPVRAERGLDPVQAMVTAGEHVTRADNPDHGNGGAVSGAEVGGGPHPAVAPVDGTARNDGSTIRQAA
jgi:hypothetical protein